MTGFNMKKTMPIFLLLTLILTACQTTEVTKQKFPPNWHSKIYGTYEGELTSGELTRRVKTTFKKSSDNQTLGFYAFYDGNNTEKGSLINCHPDDFGTLSCTWQDKYGNGVLKLAFTSTLDEFKGLWGFKTEKPKYVWNGKLIK